MRASPLATWETSSGCCRTAHMWHPEALLGFGVSNSGGVGCSWLAQVLVDRPPQRGPILLAMAMAVLS